LSFYLILTTNKCFLKLDNIRKATKSGINKSFAFLGKELVKDSRQKMKDTERDLSKTYFVRVRGRIIRHNPSKPGFPAAIMTGALSKSVRYNVNGSDSMKFGAGYFNKVDYAGFVELGTKRMVARPYLRPAILENDRNAFTAFEKYIKRVSEVNVGYHINFWTSWVFFRCVLCAV
jgi:hypothetical protein